MFIPKHHTAKPVPALLRVKHWTLSLILTASLVPVSLAHAETAQALDQDQQRIDEVYDLLSKVHVSGTPGASLSESAIKGMIESLHDPYTQYLPEKDWQRFESGLERHFVGIGIGVGKSEKGYVINQVLHGSPAEEAKLQLKDIIAAVNSQPVGDKTLDELVSLIRGEENTSVVLTILRGDTKLDVTVQRRSINLPIVDANLLPGGIGVLKVYSFSSDADELFANYLADWSQKGIRSLVIDLRDNPGGLLDTANNIAKDFIKKGVLIHTSDRDKTDHPVEITNGNTVNYPVYVLVNENSASASEVLSGALQDYKVATIVGTKTFGKGSVQSVFQLSDGSRIKITVDEYFTPNGNKVNQTGITPDISVEGPLPQLLTVLKKAGAEKLELKKEDNGVSVNGLSTTDPLIVREEGNQVFVHSRVLAALVGADITWNGENGSVEITSGNKEKKAEFSLSSGESRFVDGYMLVELGAFSRAFPELSWTKDGSKLVLSAGKGD